MAWEIFEPVASRYEAWYGSEKGLRVDRAEKALLAWMLELLPGTETILEVGCGTGHFSRYLTSRSLRVVGMDRSPAMLASLHESSSQIARVQADAHNLPFRDRTVDAAVFVTSLEFLDEPRRALAEAVRVSRRGLMLIVLNRWSLGGMSRRIGPQASQTILGCAQDYSLSSLRTVLFEMRPCSACRVSIGGTGAFRMMSGQRRRAFRGETSSRWRLSWHDGDLNRDPRGGTRRPGTAFHLPPPLPA